MDARGLCRAQGVADGSGQRKGGWGEGGMQRAESGKLEELGRCACGLRSLRRAALVPSRCYCKSCLSISGCLIGQKRAYLIEPEHSKTLSAIFECSLSLSSSYNHELVMIYIKQT